MSINKYEFTKCSVKINAVIKKTRQLIHYHMHAFTHTELTETGIYPIHYHNIKIMA